MDPEVRACQNCKKEFTSEAEDFDFYKKINVPPPTWCPPCRLQRRMVWRNERYLFRRKSDKSGKDIFSMFPQTSGLVVWDKEEWIADDWDQNASGMEYDWSKPFFEQFRELLSKAPVPSRGFFRFINSDYSNNASDLKDCYLVFGCVDVENGAYLENSVRVKDSLDVSFVSDSQLSYECFFNIKCYNALYSSHSEDCQDIYFCRDCTGSSNCFGCVGLRGKSYYIFNQPYSKEEYDKKIKEFAIDSYAGREKQKNEIAEFWRVFPVRCVRSYKNSNCKGEYISNSKNVTNSYYVDGCENMKYCHSVYAKPARDCYDQYRYGGNCELMYDTASCGGNSSSIRFSYLVFDNSREADYSFHCTGCSNIFGCAGLNKKQYCILNKQYSEEEYGILIKKIRAHMADMPYIDAKGKMYTYGEYFPFELSPVAYNESVAQEFFPLTKEEAVAKGFVWREMERKPYSITMTHDNIPDAVSDINDGIIDEIIECEHIGVCAHECTKAFRIIPQELQLYRKLNIPLPHLCPNCRYFERIIQRAPIATWKRPCECGGAASSRGGYVNIGPHSHGEGKCPNEFETSYAPDRPEIVYCESCYQSEVA